MKNLIGFKDKLYWREAAGKFHCFTRGEHRQPIYVTLCGCHVRRWIGGQSCSRPKAVLRCAECDVLEMRRRGWDESGPESTYTPRLSRSS